MALFRSDFLRMCLSNKKILLIKLFREENNYSNKKNLL